MGTSKLDRHFRRFQRSGDVRALAAVFDLAAPELMRVGRHLCGDEAEAEDAVQATFETAIGKAASHDGRRPVMPWLLGVLAIHARKARERAGREPDPQRLADRLTEREVADPADLASDAELRALVERKVDELPATYAQTLRRYLTEGAAPQEIADGLGITPGAVHVRIHRGLKLLRGLLPAGAALGGSLTTARARGLQAVRSDLIEQAGGHGIPAVAGGGGAVAIAWKPLALAGSLAAAAALVLAVGPLGGSPSDDDGPSAAAPTAALVGIEAPLTADASGSEGDLARAAVVADGGAAVASAPAKTAPTFGGLTAEEWLARFEAVEGWREIVPLGDQIAALPDDEALELMRAIYHRLPTVDHRRQVLKSFVFGGGVPYALEILDLAAADPSLAVQEWAWGYLEEYAFEDFSLDPSRYAAWRERTAGLPVSAVLRDSTATLVARLARLGPEELRLELDRLDKPDARIGTVAGLDLPATLRDAGLPDLLAQHIEGGDYELVEQSLGWITATEPDEPFLRGHVLPLLDRLPTEGDDENPYAELGLHALGRSGQNWVVDELMLRLARDPERWGQEDELYDALGELGDPRVVPDLVDHLSRHDDRRTRYLLGYLALSELTGVDYDESQDAAFWLGWLDRNGERLQTAIDSFER